MTSTLDKRCPLAPHAQACGWCIFGFCLLCNPLGCTQLGDFVCDPACVETRDDVQGGSGVKKRHEAIALFQFCSCHCPTRQLPSQIILASGLCHFFQRMYCVILQRWQGNFTIDPCTGKVRESPLILGLLLKNRVVLHTQSTTSLNANSPLNILQHSQHEKNYCHLFLKQTLVKLWKNEFL